MNKVAACSLLPGSDSRVEMECWPKLGACTLATVLGSVKRFVHTYSGYFRLSLEMYNSET